MRQRQRLTFRGSLWQQTNQLLTGFGSIAKIQIITACRATTNFLAATNLRKTEKHSTPGHRQIRINTSELGDTLSSPAFQLGNHLAANLSGIKNTAI